MFGRNQVRASGRDSDDVVGTRREIAESSPKVLRACWEFTGSSLKVSGACREFAGSSPRVIGGLPGVHWELTEGDRGLARSPMGAHRR
ncbi:hypothetical protein BHE74_00034395 [Ensete ventricosum]|nr:hypothetical protein BHE74_00034395 [Ensete ventricosum]